VRRTPPCIGERSAKEYYGYDPLEPIKATGKLCTGTNMVLEVVES
jgi:hypothetical protein